MNYINNIKVQKPLINCITNKVTINDVANAILSMGGSPLMTSNKIELEDVISVSKALYLNLGALSDVETNVYIYAIEMAKKYKKPIVFDAVAVGGSQYRKDAAQEILHQNLTVVHGNYSEISYLSEGIRNTKGVDSEDIKVEIMIERTKKAAIKYNTIVFTTGPVDIISNGTESYLVKNSSPLLEKITGAGCIVSGLVATAIAANDDPLMSTVYAGAFMALAGELAEKDMRGLGDFKVNLFNHLSNLDDKILKEEMRIEKI